VVAQRTEREQGTRERNGEVRGERRGGRDLKNGGNEGSEVQGKRARTTASDELEVGQVPRLQLGVGVGLEGVPVPHRRQEQRPAVEHHPRQQLAPLARQPPASMPSSPTKCTFRRPRISSGLRSRSCTPAPKPPNPRHTTPRGHNQGYTSPAAHQEALQRAPGRPHSRTTSLLASEYSVRVWGRVLTWL